MRRRDISKVLIGSAAGSSLLAVSSQAQAACVPACYPQTGAETAAGVTPLDYSYMELDLRRYYSGSGTYDAAMASAIAVCGATGGTIVLPRGTLNFSSSITLTSKVSVILQGQGGISAGGPPATSIQYTGTANVFINLDSSLCCAIRDCQITYSNPGFGGKKLIKAGNNGSGDCFMLCVERCLMGSNIGAGAIGIALDGAICFSARDCHFHFGNPAITGRESAGSNYSNVIKFYNCIWTRSRLVPVLFGGEAWLFSGCTFEQMESGAPNAFADVGSISRGMTFEGCWFGDSTASGIWIQYAGSGWYSLATTSARSADPTLLRLL
jgi:hypothetical protein